MRERDKRIIVRAIRTDGHESRRKWVLNRRNNLVHLLADVPVSLPTDMLDLTVCCRYAESLLKNPRVKKYLIKHHPEKLHDLEALLGKFERGGV
jgi:hypothetical protein